MEQDKTWKERSEFSLFASDKAAAWNPLKTIPFQ